MSVRALSVVVLALAGASLTPQAASAEAAGSPGAGAFLDVGGAHGCAVQTDATTRCWGKGSSGRLGSRGLGDLLSTGATAASVVDVGPTVAVDSGAAHTCAVTTAAVVRCWGQGGAGQLGSGTRDNRLDGILGVTGTDDATEVALGEGAKAVSAGGFFTCALTSGGSVRCWGQGTFGALGSRATDNRLDGLGSPDQASTVPLGGPATAVSTGTRHACALMSSGVVRCWGSGENGRLGTGATDDRLDGVAGPAGTDEASVVSLGEPAIAIAAGGSHTCALKASGSVACWGAGTQGQLGSGSVADLSDEPGEGASDVVLKPAGLTQSEADAAPRQRVVAISAGDAHSCAVTSDGDVRCWGRGDLGQLGQGARDARLDADPRLLADAATFVGRGPAGAGVGLGAAAVAVSAAEDSTCALLSTGAVRCWGAGADGRLGSRATDARLDGLVDSATRTDDASLVPLGPIALTTPRATDSTPSPGPSASPVPLQTPVTRPIAPGSPNGAKRPSVIQSEKTTIPGLSFRFRLKNRNATVAAMLRSTRTGRCPSRARGVLRQGNATLARVSLRVKVKGSNCRAAASFKLGRSVKRSGKVLLTIRAPGLAARRLPPTG